MRLLKYNEMFDTEELKSKFEMPYLKGEMGKLISKFSKFASEYKDELDVFLHKILFRYPVISKFHQQEVNGVPVFFATSKTEAEDRHEHYAQIAMTYENNEYTVVVIMRRLEDLNEKNWFVKTYGFPTIEESYHFFDMFIGACKKFNIVEDSDTFDVMSN
jgi:hypothetical protein